MSTAATTAAQPPSTHRALVLRSFDTPPQVETVPTPQAAAGSAVLRVLAAGTVAYSREIYNGKRGYPMPLPVVPGTSAIARVAAVGRDATQLQPGQLVLLSSLIRSRDTPTDAMLMGVHEGFSPAAPALMRGEWRDATYAEYVKAPLENLFPLDEARLLGSPADGGLGYAVEDLLALAVMTVPIGGLRDVRVEAGETVIVSPATGNFGGAAVAVALALGANVIAMGRNPAALDKVKRLGKGRVETVRMTGNVDDEVAALKTAARGRAIDVFFDISPPMAQDSTHFRSAVLSLRHGGRVSLMGGLTGDIALPHMVVMHRNLTIKGKWMYEADDVTHLIKMVVAGTLTLGKDAGFGTAGKFPLDQWKEAFDTAAEKVGLDQLTCIQP